MERRPPHDRPRPGQGGPPPRRPQHSQAAMPLTPFGPPPKPELFPPPPKPKRTADPIAKPGTSHVAEEELRIDAERVEVRAARKQVAAVPRQRRKRLLDEPALNPTDICRVLFSDDDMVVVDKTAGFPVNPGGAFAQRSVVRSLHAQGFDPVFPINLLDAEASGLVLFSRSAAAAKALRWNWRSSLCVRTYMTVVQGDIQGTAGRISHAIGAVATSTGLRHKTLTVEEGGRSAITEWKLLSRARGMSRLELTLKSGRCHQARIHLAAIGHPVVGDRLHGRNVGEVPIDALIDIPGKHLDGNGVPRGQIALHFYRIVMPHPITQQPMRWTAPVPRTMLALMPGPWIVPD